MKFSIRKVVPAAFLVAGLAFAVPQDQGAKQDMKDAGHATKKAAKKTGHAIKKTTKKAAHKVKKGAEKVEDKTNPN